MQDSLRSRLVLDLFERYYERVYAFARRSVDPATAEDVAQEVFVRLLDLPDLERRTIAASYLVKIADNLVKRRFWRKRKLDSILESTARDPITRSHAAGRSAGRSAPVAASRVAPTPTERLGELNPGGLRPAEREVLDLVVCRGLSYQQAAASLGVRVSDVNNWKHRGIQRLKQHAGSEPARTERPGSDRGPDRSVDRSVDRSFDRAVDRAVDRTVDRASDRPVGPARRGGGFGQKAS